MTQNTSDLASDELLNIILSRRAPGQHPRVSEGPAWEHQPKRFARYAELRQQAERGQNVVLVVQNVFSSPGGPQGDDARMPFIHDALLHMATHNVKGEFPWTCPNGVVIDICLTPSHLEIHARVMKQLSVEAVTEADETGAAP